MKLLLVLASLIASCVAEYCLNDVIAACKPAGGGELVNCNAKYGKIEDVDFELQSFANKNIANNFHYLLLSTYFNNYENNREGFGKLFRKLSDKSWNDGIELIKYMTKRGLTMNFQAKNENKDTSENETVELNEFESLSNALDIQKSLAAEAHRIHLLAKEDAEAMSHIENTFVHSLRDSVRELSGHTNDLKALVSSKQASLNVYLFDEYLQKLY